MKCLRSGNCDTNKEAFKWHDEYIDLLAFYASGGSNSYLIFLAFLEIYLTFSCAFMRAEGLLSTKYVVWGSTAGRPHPTDTGLITNPWSPT